MDAARAAEELDAYTVVDVREPGEWEAGFIAGSIHIPMAEVVARHAEIPEDKPVLVVCRVGGRSARVRQFLAGRGRMAENLEGGLLAWVEAGQPLVTDAGTPGVVADH
jgi:rhodanese-related sulfurtransferase